MALSLDRITLGVADVATARQFYEAVYSPTVDDHGGRVFLDVRGVVQLSLRGIEALAEETGTTPSTSGFRGFSVASVLSEPSEVETILTTATQNGATVLKPAKKSLFGGFRGWHRTPDGVVWELASQKRKDTGPVGDPPSPTETLTVLGVAEPKESKTFYQALGMTIDRDYGSTFVDFQLSPGTVRLGLMQRKALAKDAGVDEAGDGFRALVLEHTAASREAVDAVLDAVAPAGGVVAVPASETATGGYAGQFDDKDGFRWRISAS